MADTAFKTPEELAAAQGLQTADFSQVQVMQPGGMLNSQFYKYAADPTVFQNANYQQPIVMQPNQVSGGTPLNLAQPTNDLTTADAAAAGAGQMVKTNADYVKEITPEPTALSKQQLDLTNKLNDIYGENVGRAAYTAEQEQASGLVQRKKDMADINAQILQKNAEYEKAVQSVELNTGGVTSTAVTGLQGAIRRNQASDISLLQARALGMQGQVQAAQDAVNRAVDLKYQEIEEKQVAYEKQLAAIAPLVSGEREIALQAAQNKLADAKEKVAEDKARSKDNLTLALAAGVKTQFVNKNGEFFDANSGKAFETQEAFFKAAGVTSFAEAYKRGLVTDFTPERVADLEFVAKARADYPEAGINAYDSAETVAAKVKATARYQKETSGDTGFTLNAGDVRYDAYGNIIASGGPAPIKPLTEAQAKDVTYAQRTDEANVYLKNLESTIAKYNPTNFLIQTKLEGNDLTHAQAADDIKQLRQAERNFLGAVLRRESGAAISDSEIDTNSRQYFARPGDDAQTLKQKAQNRQTAIDNFKASNPNNTGSTSGVPTGSPPAGEIWVQRKSDGGYGSIPTNEYDSNLYDKVSFNSVGKTSASYRTDRNNNPIAAAVSKGSTNQFTKALDQAGVKWTYGDPFSTNSNMHTIKILGDPVEGSRAILAKSNAVQGWYASHTGKSVLSKYGIKNNVQFAQAPRDVQNAIIKGIYKAEVGSGVLTNGFT